MFLSLQRPSYGWQATGAEASTEIYRINSWPSRMTVSEQSEANDLERMKPAASESTVMYNRVMDPKGNDPIGDEESDDLLVHRTLQSTALRGSQ